MFWETGSDLAFDTAVIPSTKNFEVALITPVRVPRISNEPVRSTVFYTPSEHFDSVTAESLATDVLIHPCESQTANYIVPSRIYFMIIGLTRFIIDEICVDGKSCFDWAIGHDFSLNLFYIAADAIS